MNEILYPVVKKIYLSNKVGRKIVEVFIINKEGGQFYSKTLRRIFKEQYDIDAGFGTYGCFTDLFRPHVIIGKYCSIASGVHRLVGNHPIENISTHPLFYKKEFGGISETRYDYHRLLIGHDVWIGVNSVIMGKCERIGNGAIIGAGSIVTHDVEPYSIVAGNPARFIRYRFPKEVIEKIEKSAWWELNHNELKKIAVYGNNIDLFIDEVNKIRNDKQ